MTPGLGAAHPGAQGGRRRERQRPPDAVPGGHPRRAGGAARGTSRPPRAGAAFLAGIGAGVWTDPEEIRGSWRAEKTFKPKMDDSARAHALAKWKRAVERA